MQGELVSLHPALTDADYATLADWSSSISSVYSSGQVQPFTGPKLREAAEQAQTHFLMVRDREGKTVGGVNWRPMTYDGHFEVGNAIGEPELWGLGYGVESVLLLLDHLFHQRNAHRIHLLTASFNKRMVQIFTSGPITVEGILRDYFFLDGQYHHAVVGSILRAEYYDALTSADRQRLDLVPPQDKVDASTLLRKFLDENPVAL
ncbi:GNAT family N-acetyltransferase [Amycolatopsis sp. NPDC059657]|uniref:GNAT family N-acetyltransferase n=1 Tax=Amycolatopsis sp. NPDC059657 TaxID=3346899 RepID=UPI00366AFCCA